MLAILISLVAQTPDAYPFTIVVPKDSPPIVWAAGQLKAAMAAKGEAATVLLQDGVRLALEFAPQRRQLPTPKEPVAEAYRFIANPSSIEISYGDAAGGMYALLDVAERVEMEGVQAARSVNAQATRIAPAIPFRAVNPFLSIPLADKDGKRDWDHWWFTDEKYWQGYLDLLAKSRINTIDMHGMYDIQVTSFPNIWPYFVVSEKYPDVGVAHEQARKNLAMLQKICKMAKDRGIKFALMNYTGGWNWPGTRKAPDRPVDDFIEYTKEGLTQIVKACPDLAMIGFRIGESGYGEDFYARSYIAALDALNRPLPLYTRTWGAEKTKLMELGRMYPNKFFIEIKYNGEQMGPPWHVSGGRMAKWRDYSYQNYLFYPRAYKVIWQIRTNGTNRVFQWANYEFIKTCVQTTTLADSVGYTIEPMSTYYPLNDFMHKVPMFEWEWMRNPLWYMMWGRLGYNPKTPESVFINAAKTHWGNEYGEAAYRMLNTLSRVVPTAKTQYSLGPDHRDHAPELEWGGSIRQWSQGQPFDTFFAMGPSEYARETLYGDYTGRQTPIQAAGTLTSLALQLDASAKEIPDGVSKSLDDLKIDAKMTGALARYYSARLMAASEFAMAEMGGEKSSLPQLRTSVQLSQAAWRNLASLGDQYYHPFLDTLRMHTQEYLWSKATPGFAQDEVDLKTMLVSDAPTKTVGPINHDAARLLVWADKVKSFEDKQTVKLHATIGELREGEIVRKVNLLWKPFRSEVDWTRIGMDPVGDEWQAAVEINTEGAEYGLEVITDRRAMLAISPDGRPYRVIDPWIKRAEAVPVP